MSQSWMILSGKGGVGKSAVTSSLGLALAKRQLTCCCMDLDIGLRSLDMLLGMQNKVVYDVLDVARKDCKLKYALIQHAQHEALALLPAAQLGDVDRLSQQDLERIIRKLKKRFGYVLLDAPAGMGPGIRRALECADHTLLVTTPDDIAMRDAERVIALLEEAGKPRPMLLVNRVVPDLVTSGDMYTPQTVASTLDVPLLGYLPEDRAVLSAINRHESFMLQEGPAQAAMERVAQRFLGEYIPMPPFKPQKRGLFGWRKHRRESAAL